MTIARCHNATPADEQEIGPVQPADCVKPVELIELLQRRTEKHRQRKSPTTSPFYDAEFVENHPARKKRQPDQSSSS